MADFFSLNVLQTALEVGLIYALVAMALFVRFSILNIADLSTDGCFTLGCAVGAMLTIAGHPILAIFAAMAAGICSGYVTAFLQTRLGVESILAGIIVNTGLYTINLGVMGFSSNVSIFGCDTVFTLTRSLLGDSSVSRIVLLAVIALIVCVALIRFFGTTLGLSIRATGDSPDMVSSSSINPKFTITVGLCLANALTALAGCLIGQYNKTCDINLGTGMVTIALASLIIGEVSRFYNIEEAVIRGTLKNKNTAEARQVAMYLVRKLTNLSLPDIGKEFGRDHSTVSHSLKKVEQQLAAGTGSLPDNIRDITANINSKL